MPLRPFDVADAATVAGWARTAEEASTWRGSLGWPEPAGSTEDGCSLYLADVWFTRP